MEQSNIKGRWFKLAEAAQQLGVSEITVRRKAKAGQLKTILRNGRYLVFLEENQELGMFTAGMDWAVTPGGATNVTPVLNSGPRKQLQPELTTTKAHPHEDLIQSLKRTIEDQQTLISSLEASISRLSQKLAVERNSNR